jgi:hypothetical protein
MRMKVKISLILAHPICRHYIGVRVTLPSLYFLRMCPLNREPDGAQGKSGSGLGDDNPILACNEILLIRLIREPIY